MRLTLLACLAFATMTLLSPGASAQFPGMSPNAPQTNSGGAAAGGGATPPQPGNTTTGVPTIRRQPTSPMGTANQGYPQAPGNQANQNPGQFFPPVPDARIEFQDFVKELAGRDLPIFGADLFKNVPTTFAPVDNVPVTADYVIGPGDEIVIRAWGQLDMDYSDLVDRTGGLNIPRVGTIQVAGIKYQDLAAHIKNSIGRIYRSFELSVTLGQLR